MLTGYILMSEDNPKLFISYSWTSPDHEQWVLNLATELRENGIDVILDKWDLKEGQDANVFMEKMVTDPLIKKVALVCDRGYTEKADSRKGGVGTETQIITPEIYQKSDQNKFVAIIAEHDDHGMAYVPVYYKSRKYIDLSQSDLYSKNFEQLLRWIYDKPFYEKPDLGSKPAFLSDTGTISLGTTATFRRTLEAIRSSKEYCRGALIEYFNLFTRNLEKFRLPGEEGEFDDRVIENIEQFLPFRNEAIEIFLALAQYRDTADTYQQLHRFLEGLIPYMERPPNITRYSDWDFDNFKFIIHELFLYIVTSLLKYECFEGVSYLLRHNYYLENEYSHGSDNTVPFDTFRHYLKSLEYRNGRLNLRSLSLHADLLQQRSKTSGISFSQLMQADFVLFIRSCLDSLRKEGYQRWWPDTLVYTKMHHTAFEIFARSQSKQYFDKVKCLFDIKNKEEIDPMMEAFKSQKLKIPRWEFTSANPFILLGYDKIATMP
jgi:hypothetical protein